MVKDGCKENGGSIIPLEGKRKGILWKNNHLLLSVILWYHFISIMCFKQSPSTSIDLESSHLMCVEVGGKVSSHNYCSTGWVQLRGSVRILHSLVKRKVNWHSPQLNLSFYSLYDSKTCIQSRHTHSAFVLGNH